jgi:hypothetical protein
VSGGDALTWMLHLLRLLPSPPPTAAAAALTYSGMAAESVRKDIISG